MRLVPKLLALFSVARGAFAQTLNGNLSGLEFSDYNILCDQTLGDANATGVYQWNPHVAQFTQEGQPANNDASTLPVQWLATVSETSGSENASVQWSLWFSTLGANYSYDIGLGYDVCAFSIEVTSEDFQLRAQDDNGDCTTAMDDACVSDLQTKAHDYTVDAIVDPDTLQTRSNLTAGSIKDVCTQISNNLQANFPQSCQVFLNETIPMSVSAFALTSADSSFLYERCTIINDTSNNFYHNRRIFVTLTKYTFDNPSIANNYYNLVNWFTVPILTVFMHTCGIHANTGSAIANSDAPVTIGHAPSKLQCIRASDLNPGSKEPSPAPEPFPLPGSGLSGGEIAGIVIGVLAGVTLIAGIAYFFFRRKRKQSRKSPKSEPFSKQEPESPMDPNEEIVAMAMSEQKPAEMEVDTSAKELSPDNEVALSGTAIKPAELDAVGRPLEKEAEVPAAELPTDVPRVKR